MRELTAAPIAESQSARLSRLIVAALAATAVIAVTVPWLTADTPGPDRFDLARTTAGRMAQPRPAPPAVIALDADGRAPRIPASNPRRTSDALDSRSASLEPTSGAAIDPWFGGLSLAPGGELAVLSATQTLEARIVGTGEVLWRDLQRGAGPGPSAVFAPDGALFVASDGLLTEREPTTGNPLARLPLPETVARLERVLTVSDDHVVVYDGIRRQVIALDRRTGAELDRIADVDRPSAARIGSVRPGASARLAIATRHRVLVRDLTRRTTVFDLADARWSAFAFDRAIRTAWIGRRDGRLLELPLDHTQPPRRAFSLPTRAAIHDIALLAGGRVVVASERPGLDVVDPASERLVARLEGPNAELVAAPQDDVLAARGADVLRPVIWSARLTGGTPNAVHSDRVTALAVDDRWRVSGDASGTVIVRSRHDGRVAMRHFGELHQVDALALAPSTSPLGATALAVSPDLAQVLDIDGMRPGLSLRPPREHVWVDARFDPSGSRLALISEHERAPSEGRLIVQQVRGHDRHVLELPSPVALAWAPSNAHLAVASRDGRWVVLDAHTMLPSSSGVIAASAADAAPSDDLAVRDAALVTEITGDDASACQQSVGRGPGERQVAGLAVDDAGVVTVATSDGRGLTLHRAGQTMRIDATPPIALDASGRRIAYQASSGTIVVADTAQPLYARFALAAPAPDLHAGVRALSLTPTGDALAVCLDEAQCLVHALSAPDRAVPPVSDGEGASEDVAWVARRE